MRTAVSVTVKIWPLWVPLSPTDVQEVSLSAQPVKGLETRQIAAKLQNIDGRDTASKNLNSLGKVLGFVCIIVCLIVFIVDVFVQGEAWDNALMTAVSLAVAAIPEGLAAVVTIVLSIGMTRMASRNAIMRKLLAG